MKDRGLGYKQGTCARVLINWNSSIWAIVVRSGTHATLKLSLSDSIIHASQHSKCTFTPVVKTYTVKLYFDSSVTPSLPFTNSENLVLVIFRVIMQV